MELKIQITGVESLEAKLKKVPAGAKIAISRAINDGIRKARTEIKKSIGQIYNLQSGRILSALKRELPVFSSPGSLFGLLHIESTKFNVEDFAARDNFPAGVNFQEIRGQNSGLSHAFIRTMASGHIGVFGRVGGGPRLPIREITGLSIPQMLENPKVEPKWEHAVEETVAARLEHHVSHLLSL
jgi:hypothetical protein